MMDNLLIKRFWAGCALLAGLYLCAGQASAALTGVSVSPLQRQLTAQNNSIALSWRVTGDALQRAGVSSAPATLIDAGSGATLGTIGMPLSAQNLAPYTLNESLNISAVQVAGWQSAGIGEIQLQREFIDLASGGSITASMSLLVPERGNFSAARVSPSQRHVFASQNNSLSLNWQVATGAGHNNGVFSQSARILDPRSGGTLATLGDVLSESGSGPFVFSEQLELDAAMVQSISARGLNRVVLERIFSDPIGGGSTKSNLILVISNSSLSAARSSAPGELSVTGLSLEFDTGNNLALSNLNQVLQAKLNLSYTGSGLLEGRWLVAEPGSSETIPLYRTLALVRRNLTSNQRVILESPMLPTVRSGKYLLRFCVNNRELMPQDDLVDPQCPLQDQLVDAAYQVQGSVQTSAVTITGVSPNQQTVDRKTPFEWLPVAGAEVYQMQLFALQAPGTSPPSSRSPNEMMEPKFITGMLLPAGTTYTPLSELVQSKLEANKQYLWRITAHDQSGRLIGSSGEYKFVYRPEEQP